MVELGRPPDFPPASFHEVLSATVIPAVTQYRPGGVCLNEARIERPIGLRACQSSIWQDQLKEEMTWTGGFSS